MKHFEINGSKLANRKGWPEGARENILCHVVAENMQKALELALAKHPDMDVWNANHRGRVDIIQQESP